MAGLHADFVPPHAVQPGRQFVAVIVSRGRVRWTRTAGEHGELVVLVTRATPDAYLAFLRGEQIPYLVRRSSK